MSKISNERLLEILEKEEPVNTHVLCDIISEREGLSIDRSTIYKQLRKLQDKNKVRKIEDNNSDRKSAWKITRQC